MATRNRDYKAEYQRRKQLAQQSGYASERAYKKRRAELKRGLPHMFGKVRVTANDIGEIDQAIGWQADYNANQVHTIGHLLDKYPGEYPSGSDREFWDAYFGNSVYSY